MRTIHKEMLCLATAYLDMYLSDDENVVDSDIKELFEFCRKEVYFTICKKDMKVAMSLTEVATNRLQLATTGVEVEVNVLSFALQCCFTLVEDDVFKMSKGMKLNRLTKSIYTKLENSIGFDDAMKNSIKIICKVVEKSDD